MGWKKDLSAIAIIATAVTSIGYFIIGEGGITGLFVSTPIADAGNPITVNEGNNVTLDGTKSAVPRGERLVLYEWIQTGPYPVSLNNPAIVNPIFKAPNVSNDEELTFKVRITDSKGSVSDFDAVNVTVKDIDQVSSTDGTQCTGNPTILYDRGQAFAKSKKYEEAIKCFDEVIEQEPNNIPALNNKGLNLYRLKDYHEAIEYFDRVLAIDPNHVDALTNEGAALDELKKHQEAITYFDKALAIGPNHINALTSKGEAFDELNKSQEAIEYFDRVLAIKPAHVNALNNKGLSLSHLKEYQDAIINFNKALAIDPNYEKAITNNGAALFELGRIDEACEYIDKALALDPKNKDAKNIKGKIIALGRDC